MNTMTLPTQEKGWSQMSKDNYNLEDLVLDACDELDNVMCDSSSDSDDAMHEIADNAVPIYY